VKWSKQSNEGTVVHNSAGKAVLITISSTKPFIAGYDPIGMQRQKKRSVREKELGD
jgi:hypothetical protein